MQALTFMRSAIEPHSREKSKGLALLLYNRGRRDSFSCVSPWNISKGFLGWLCGSREGLGSDFSFSQAC